MPVVMPGCPSMVNSTKNQLNGTGILPKWFKKERRKKKEKEKIKAFWKVN
jgi:hypothetical protein